jgi:putative ABC transport system permease protein
MLETLAYSGGSNLDTEMKLIREVAKAFPSVTAVRVKEALKAISDLVGQLSLGIRAAAAITLVASILVLAGALAAGHHTRVYDAVILKTLGATRRRLVLVYAIEYALLGFITASIAIVAGTLAGAYVVKEVMRFSFVFAGQAAIFAAAFAVLLTVLFGLIGTWRALGQKPASVLRNL